jgi:hypothetical protein
MVPPADETGCVKLVKTLPAQTLKGIIKTNNTTRFSKFFNLIFKIPSSTTFVVTFLILFTAIIHFCYPSITLTKMGISI